MGRVLKLRNFAQILVSPLERRFDARAGFCCCLSARAAVWTLEREFPSLSILVVCRKFWESAPGARADLWTLEREPVSVRSSGVLYARADLLLYQFVKPPF